MEVTKGVAPITIVLETPEEIDLFFHILNYAPQSEEQYYPFDAYMATFEEVNEFRKILWNILSDLGVELETTGDC